MGEKVNVIKESDTSRNIKFQDNSNGKIMNRPQFVREIKNGNYDNYYVRKINGLATPVSKPDGNTRNNLG